MLHLHSTEAKDEGNMEKVYTKHIKTIFLDTIEKVMLMLLPALLLIFILI